MYIGYNIEYEKVNINIKLSVQYNLSIQYNIENRSLIFQEIKIQKLFNTQIFSAYLECILGAKSFITKHV